MATGSHTHSHQVVVGGKQYTTNAKAHSHSETPDTDSIAISAEATARIAADKTLTDAIASLTSRIAALENETPVPPIPPIPIPPIATSVVGYGIKATGGTDQTPVAVKNLNASGPGSLYEAIMGGNNRFIHFEVEGTIDTTRPGDLNQDGNPYEIEVSNRSAITIDGSTAPGAGITITKYGLEFKGGSNMILRHLAFRDILGEKAVPPDEHQTGCLTFRGTKNFVVDHCSFSGFRWRGIDVITGCADATIQWCFFGPYAGTGYDYQMHIAGQPNRISVDHNLFFRGSYRHPEFDYDWTDGKGPVPVDTTGDMANCLVYDDIGGTGHYGTIVQGNARVNIRNSYYHAVANGGANGYNRVVTATAFPIIGDNGKIYKSGLVSNAGTNLTSYYETSTPWAVPSYAVLPLESSAVVAANSVKSGAGRFPRDSVDTSFAASIVIG
jgi:hypothetical protein